ncbi:Ion transport domain [Trinorchestia longiramus]|nr:Ion transport domain [Trinorchestia longiramus]
MWNVIDFITNALYVATVALRIVSFYQVEREQAAHVVQSNSLSRDQWDTWDPMLIAEGLFAAANIFSSLKLVYIFSVNPYLGPLQVSLSRMVVDILKFAFLYLLTLFAFSCGMNQLLWFYADLEKADCEKDLVTHVTIGDNITALVNDSEPERDYCVVKRWRRFSNLFETLQTLFWAAFGLIDLTSFDLKGIKYFTRFWGMFMFGTYSVINVIVLLNLLIAMMNHSYQLVSERADVEWKFARSKLWISYFEEGETCPPPFNIIITPKSVYYFFRWFHRKFCRRTKAAKKEHMKTIRSIMRNLVRRYVTVEQRKAENQGVTEDDVNEIKQDISAFRCELVEILKDSGMNTSTASTAGQGIRPRGSSGGKKNRQKERRLMKGFNIGVGSLSNPLGNSISTTGGSFNEELVDTMSAAVSNVGAASRALQQRSPASKLARLARLAEAKLGRPTNKKRWGTLVEAAKTAKVSKMLSKSRSDESLSSGNECEQEQEPLQDEDHSPEDANNVQDNQDAENRITVAGILRSNSGGGGLSLDPAALAARHLTEKFRTRRPPKTSVSFDENIPAAETPNENQESSLDNLIESTEEVRPPAGCSSSVDSRSVSPSLAVSESCEPLMMDHNRSISNQNTISNRLSPSNSEPPPDIPSITRPANGSLQAPRLPGVQPINRQMTGGWL